MKDLADNNVVHFKNISKKKEAMYANYVVSGIRKGVIFRASIAVDLASVELDPTESLETIIEECAKKGVKEFKMADLKFEGIESL